MSSSFKYFLNIYYIHISIIRSEYNIGKISCIYRITNNINNKIYVGKTNNLKRRIKEYRNKTNKPLKPEAKYEIMIAMKKYGFKNFTFDILEKCDINLLDEREIYWIDKLDSRNPLIGYNKKTGGIGGTMPEDTHLKMSMSSMGFKHSEEHKEKMSKAIITFKDNKFKIWKSAKVFADNVNLARTNVTAAIKRGTKARGFYVFYKDINDRLSNKPNTKDTYYYKILQVIEREDVETIEKDFYIVI